MGFTKKLILVSRLLISANKKAPYGAFLFYDLYQNS